MSSTFRLRGMTAITVLSAGQLVSIVGSGMTNFAVMIWLWQTTGQATAHALLGVFAFGPMIALAPLAGALVDRWDRKLTMILSDLGAAVATAGIFVLVLSDQLALWKLCALGALAGSFQAFQGPAYGAAVTMMVAKEHYARANALLTMTVSAGHVLSPILAALLLGPLGLEGIVIVDLLSFGVGVASLAVIRVPPPPESEEGRKSRGNLGDEMLFGWRYIRARPSLLGLLSVFCSVNFGLMLSMIVLPAMVLARTGNDELAYGTVSSMIGLGALTGAVVLSVWGGPRRRIHGVLAATFFLGLTGFALGLGHGLVVWSAAAFAAAFSLPVSAGCSQAIWQAKVPPDVQGRVFATRRLLAQAAIPLAFLLGGPLGDRVFRPALQPGGALAAVLGPVVGTDPGAEYAVLFLASGLIGLTAALAGYSVRAVREVEDLLPDHGVELS